MNDRTFAPIIGFVTSLVSFEIWQNILLSFIIAFVGGVAAWLARKLCDYVNLKFKSRKSVNHESRTYPSSK